MLLEEECKQYFSVSLEITFLAMANIFCLCSSLNCFFCVFSPFAMWFLPLLDSPRLINRQTMTKSWKVYFKYTRIWSKHFFQHLHLIPCYRHQNYLSYIGKIEEVKIKSSSLVHRIYFWEVVSSIVIKGRGGDKNVSKKRKFRETQKEKLTGDHA